MERDFKANLRASLSLDGLRTNADPVPSPHTNRKRELFVKPKRDSSFLPEPSWLIRQNGTENAAHLRAKYAIPFKSEGLIEWVTAQRVYVESLSKRDKDIMLSYTFLGDTLVNNYARGTLHDLTDMFSKPSRIQKHLSFLGYYLYDLYDTLTELEYKLPRSELMTGEQVNERAVAAMLWNNKDNFVLPEFIAPFLAAYLKDLKRIIEAAPRLTSPLVVYRGFRSEAHLRGLEYENPDFISTSISISKALSFSTRKNYFNHSMKHTDVEYYGGMYEITVNPEIPCLYMELHTKVDFEFEVLLPPGLHFTFDSKIHYKLYKDGGLSFREKRIGIIHVDVRNTVGGLRRKTRRRKISILN